MKSKASVLAGHPWFRRLLTGARACAVVSALVAVASVVAEQRREADRSTITLPPVAGAIAPTTADPPSTIRLRRPRYRHSVIVGGAFSREEVEDVVREDPVVAAHYGGVDLKRLREAELREPRDVYVSYRIGPQVYWTRKPVRLTVGETLLTDGTSEIRARCGNRISDIPQEPVSDLEPIPEELNERRDPSGETSVTGERALGPAAPGPVPSLPFLALTQQTPGGYGLDGSPEPATWPFPSTPGVLATLDPYRTQTAWGEPTLGIGPQGNRVGARAESDGGYPPDGPAGGTGSTSSSPLAGEWEDSTGGSPPAGEWGNWAGASGSVPTTYPGSTRVELPGDAPTVPEPGILGLLGLGVGATIARWARKRRKELRAK